MKRTKHLGITIHEEPHYKLKYIAQYEGRSCNGQILYLIQQYILKFEKENGIIEMPKNVKE